MEEVELKEIVVGGRTEDSGSDDEEMYKENNRTSFKSPGLGAELVWKDICFSVGKGKQRKRLLNGVSGRAQGELVAIMGGSGKSILFLSSILSLCV